MSGDDDSHHTFRSYKLRASNFNVWTGSSAGDEIADTLTLFAENLRSGIDDEAVVTELLLKAGFDLTSEVHTIDLSGRSVYSVEDRQLLVCVGDPLTLDVVEAMAELEPALILVLDSCFGGDDELKVNAMQTIRSRNQGSGSDIALKVV